jgi:hypothetical protein
MTVEDEKRSSGAISKEYFLSPEFAPKHIVRIVQEQVFRVFLYLLFTFSCYDSSRKSGQRRNIRSCQPLHNPETLVSMADLTRSFRDILLGAGTAATLLQIAEPGVGAGVNKHSNFTYQVQGRLSMTMTFVYSMAYGTPAEKKTIVDLVTNFHLGVSGTLDEGRDKGKSCKWPTAKLNRFPFPVARLTILPSSWIA